MTERAPLFDERKHAEMVALVGPDRIGHFLGILARRLEGLGAIGGGDVKRDHLPEIHRVVSEAGCLGFARLSTECRALEQALKAGDADAAARAAALAGDAAGASLERLRTMA